MKKNVLQAIFIKLYHLTWPVVIFSGVLYWHTTSGQICDNDFTTNDTNSISIDSNIVYSNPNNPPKEWNCTDTVLTYDVYYPSNYNFTNKKLPAIFMIHGGGFKDGTTKKRSAQYCAEFAMRNFIAINIEYRTGLKDGESCFSATRMFAVYRAIQDVRGAIRKVVADEKSSSPPNYRIDLDALFIGGMSAGAITAGNVAYFNPGV